MTETGTVTKVWEGMASVEFAAQASCANCNKECGKKYSMDAVNGVLAETGDRVQVETKTGSVLLSGFTLYILPLILGAAGLIAGVLAGSEALAFALFAVMIISSVAGIKAADKHLAAKSIKYTPRIVAVLPPVENEDKRYADCAE